MTCWLSLFLLHAGKRKELRPYPSTPDKQGNTETHRPKQTDTHAKISRTKDVQDTQEQKPRPGDLETWGQFHKNSQKRRPTGSGPVDTDTGTQGDSQKWRPLLFQVSKSLPPPCCGLLQEPPLTPNPDPSLALHGPFPARLPPQRHRAAWPGEAGPGRARRGRASSVRQPWPGRGRSLR